MSAYIKRNQKKPHLNVHILVDILHQKKKINLGLNLKKTGIFSKGLRTPWFGMAVIREVMTLVLP